LKSAAFVSPKAARTAKPDRFKFLMPTGKGVRVLARPSWLTPQRLLTGLGVLLAVSIVAVGWTVMVSKRTPTLKVLVREKEKARLELREAHDQLEERVKERTAQLKLQITARKELELQSKATLAERTRLAQELHDTLEQSLTGVALQLDTTTKLFEKETDGAKASSGTGAQPGRRKPNGSPPLGLELALPGAGAI
jgi:signal transduction histidine kinase